MQLCKEDGSVPILQSVFGSSTGINKDFIFGYDFAETVKNLNGVKVANAVQGRLEKPWLKEALDKDAVVMTSGSRFYRGPPHSGAVFIPPSIMSKLKQVDSEEIHREWKGGLVPTGLNTFFGKNEFPKEL